MDIELGRRAARRKDSGRS